MEKELPWHKSTLWLDSRDCRSLCFLIWHRRNLRLTPIPLATSSLIASFLKPPECLSCLLIIAEEEKPDPNEAVWPTNVYFLQFGMQALTLRLCTTRGGRVSSVANSTHMFNDWRDCHTFGMAYVPGGVKVTRNGNVRHIATSTPGVALAPDGHAAAVQVFLEGFTCIQILDTVDYSTKHVRLWPWSSPLIAFI